MLGRSSRNRVPAPANIPNTSGRVLLLDFCREPDGYKLNIADVFGGGPTLGEVTG